MESTGTKGEGDAYRHHRSASAARQVHISATQIARDRGSSTCVSVEAEERGWSLTGMKGDAESERNISS